MDITYPTIPLYRMRLDHWRVLLYVADAGNVIKLSSLRICPARHPLVGRYWTEKYGTRVHFERGSNKLECLPYHDDIDVLHDLQAAGFVRIDNLAECRVVSTPKGRDLLNRLMAFKRTTGKSLSAFIPAPSPYPPGRPSIQKITTGSRKARGWRGEPERHAEVAKLGGDALKERYGEEYFKELGKKGGRPKGEDKCS